MKLTPSLTLSLALLLTSSPLLVPQAQAQRSKRFDQNQYYRAPHSVHGKTVVLPIGTTFEGRINTTLSSQKSAAGQRFAIIMSSPLIANGTDVIVPAGSQVIGEVVEAVPASRVPRPKAMPKQLVRGKLRVQLNGLLTPDGITHPLVADLAGDQDKDSRGRSHGNRHGDLGTSVAYMGSAAGFEAVGNAATNRYKQRPGQAPQIMSKAEALRHEIFGYGGSGQYQDDQTPIRSLVLNKRDYWIMSGSSLTVRLSAPLKIGITPQGMGQSVSPLSDEPPLDEALPTSTRNQNNFDAPSDNFDATTPRQGGRRYAPADDGRQGGPGGPQGGPGQPQQPGPPPESSF